MEAVLLGPLHRLEAIGEAHPEVFDSDVRQAMQSAIFDGFLKPEPDYVLPEDFTMFTPEGNRKVQQALAWLLAASREAAEHAGLDGFHKRLKAFQNPEIRTAQQNCYNDFFGWLNPKFFDEAGNVIRRR